MTYLEKYRQEAVLRVAATVTCPICGAGPGTPCNTGGVTRHELHRARWIEAGGATAHTRGDLLPLPSATGFTCRWCKALPGVPCVTNTGSASHPHKRRVEDAQRWAEQWRTPCPTCGAGINVPCTGAYGGAHAERWAW